MKPSLESRYYDFLLQSGYISEEANSELLQHYSPFFQKGARILDLGCGSGQHAQILEGKGCVVVGVDNDPAMAAKARAKGIEVIEKEVLASLKETSDESFDGIFCSNLIEHLPPEAVSALCAESHRVLRSDGHLLLATPNPSSLIVHLYEFWRDPTHVRPYNLQVVEFFLWDTGFECTEKGTNPHSAWTPHQVEQTLLKPSVEIPPRPEMDENLSPKESIKPRSFSDDRKSTAGKIHRRFDQFLTPHTEDLERRLKILRESIEKIHRSQQNQTGRLADQIGACANQLEQLFEQVSSSNQSLSKLQDDLNWLFPPREIFALGQKRKS